MGYLDTTIFFICNDPERALGLELFLPNFHIICIDDNPIIDYIIEKGGNVFCLERELGKSNTIFRNSNKLINQPCVQDYIKQHTPEDEVPKVIFFKIAANIEKTCENLNYWVLNTSSDLNKKFETKISQYELLKDAAVNFPKTLVGPLGEFQYSDLVEELGENFIIQYARGHTGSSTVFITGEESFLAEQKTYPKRVARIARKIVGDAWTINACVTRIGVLYGGLSYQITGIPELTSREGGTVGNDWSRSSKLSEFSIDQIKKITVRVGKAMRRAGFKGLFGLDLIVDENGEVFLIEVNARQPASTSMHTKLMLEQNLIPLQVFHIAEFSFEDDERFYGFINSINKKITKEDNIDANVDFTLRNEMNGVKFRKSQNAAAIQSINASQIFLRNTGSDTLTVSGLAKPGVYSFDEKLNRIRDGYSVSDVSSDDEFLVLAQNTGLDVSSGSELARIQCKTCAVDENGNLEEWVIKSLLLIKNILIS